MVPIDTPRKRIALSLSIMIIALSLTGSTALAATKTISVKKTSSTSHAIKKPTAPSKSTVIKKKTQVKGQSTSAARVKTLAPDAAILTQYTVMSGDTVSAIAKKFSVDESDIFDLNGLATTDKIHAGTVLVIPVNTPINTSTKPAITTPISVPAAPQPAAQSPVTTPVTIAAATIPAIKTININTPTSTTALRGGYYVQPVTGLLTQGIHDINAVDFGCPIGSDVHAAAGGTVFIIKGGSAYNGGYGNYIVINHANGTQTLYAHLSQVNVTMGQTVTQGQLIGLSGMTGRATGPHLHLEVRGAMNPWGDDALGTHYTAE
jgi:murein DD-endopeptidase MepM/ murein hydrolase activator NlpD